MMKKLLSVSENEKQRILEMHGLYNKLNVITEQATPYKALEGIFLNPLIKGLEKSDSKAFDELGTILLKRSDETLSGAFDRVLAKVIETEGREGGIEILKFCKKLSSINSQFSEQYAKLQTPYINKMKVKYPEKWEQLVEVNFGKEVLEKYKTVKPAKVTPPKPPKPATPPTPPKEIPTKLEGPVKYRTSSGKEITVKQKDVDKAIDDAATYIKERQVTEMDEAQTLDIWNTFKSEITNLKPGDLIGTEGILFKNPKSTEFFNQLLRLSKANPKFLPKAEKDEFLRLLQKNLNEDEKIVINSIWNGVQKNESYLKNLPEKWRWIQAPIKYIKNNPKKVFFGSALGFDFLDGDSDAWSFLKTIGTVLGVAWVIKTLNNGNSNSKPEDFDDLDNEEGNDNSRPGGGKEVG